MSTPTDFPSFVQLPLELRIRIFSFALNSRPRVIDIWSTSICRVLANTTFYSQKYHSVLTSLNPHPLLHASHESRAEALRHLSLEFQTIFPHSEVKHVEPAKWYINWDIDVFLPRGYWNICSFLNLIKRGWGRWRHLALDVSGAFWVCNVLEAVGCGEWLFEGIEEICLYDSGGDEFWKDKNGFIDADFVRRWDGGYRELVFVDCEASEKVRDAEALLQRYFRRFERMLEEAVEEDDEEDAATTSFSSTAETLVGDEELEQKRKPLLYLEDSLTEVEIDHYFQAPRIRLVELRVLGQDKSN